MARIVAILFLTHTTITATFRPAVDNQASIAFMNPQHINKPRKVDPCFSWHLKQEKISKSEISGMEVLLIKLIHFEFMFGKLSSCMLRVDCGPNR